MTKSKKLWTREELILTFFLYLKLPFGQMHRNNPEVKELAQIIGRSVNAVALRLANFAACDPFLKKRGIRGMPGGLKQCQPIWDEFYNDKETLLYESECALSTLKNCSSNSFIDFSANIELDILGIDKQRVKKERINQFLFRKMVLANYNYKCAISGMDIPELLVASHIIPWSVNMKERLNPTNGICLSSLYDKAFDTGLISLDYDLKVVLSPQLKTNSKKEYYLQYFAQIENKQILFPEKYFPEKNFVKWHFENIFKAV